MEYRHALAPQWRQADPKDRHTRRLECRDGVVDPPDVSLAPRIGAEFESFVAAGRGRLGSGGRGWFGSIELLRGGGDNGKTVLVRTLIRLLGDQLVRAQRVEDLDKNRFAMGSLFGKLLFVDDDVRAGVRLPDGILKTISEAKEVTGELKYQQHFNFVVRTVPMLLCNNVPSLADLSHGMLQRLMVFPFDRRFTDADRDPDLFEDIWANELPGVLNRALAGYKRILKRGAKFKRPTPVKAATTLWLQHANPLPAFIEANCLLKDRCLLKRFYQAYCSWTREMGYTLTQTQQAMTRNLEHLGYATKKTNKGVAVIGLTLSPEATRLLR
jgi:putative DNA primase/helicase